MRILHTADWHLGKTLEGKSRIEEQEKFLSDFVKIVNDNDIDLIIIAGDIYDSSNPPAKAEKLFYDTLKKVSKNGKRIVLVIAGNHDNPERLVAAAPIAMNHGIIIVGTPKTIVTEGQYGKHSVINAGEGFLELEINRERAVILTVPYPSEKRLNEVLYGEMDSDDEKIKSYNDRIRTLFSKLEENYREDTINIVVSHLFTMNSEMSGSENSMQLGGSYLVSGDCFPKQAQYIALGHVHKPQIVPGTNKKARYAGSPLHYNKKEIYFDKKCFVIDVKAREECNVKEILFKVYKPIEVWKCCSIEAAILKCLENSGKESFVYIEIDTDRYIREDEIKQMKDLKDDIIEITPKLNSDVVQIDDFISLSEKSFEEVFKEFYKKERGADAEEEIVELLSSIILEEGE